MVQMRRLGMSDLGSVAIKAQPQKVVTSLLCRMLALAYRDVPADELPEEGPACGGEEVDVAGKERELVLVALVGIEDPLRREVPEAIRQCQRAGITVRMLTGGSRWFAACSATVLCNIECLTWCRELASVVMSWLHPDSIQITDTYYELVTHVQATMR